MGKGSLLEQYVGMEWGVMGCELDSLIRNHKRIKYGIGSLIFENTQIISCGLSTTICFV